MQHYELSEDAESGSLLSFNIPRDASDGIVNNRKELFKFRSAVSLSARMLRAGVVFTGVCLCVCLSPLNLENC